MELLPKVFFTELILGGICKLARGIDREQGKFVWTSVENKDCKA